MELSQSEVIQIWFHYEEIAMHFNELIMQYRLQLMGGTGAIGVLMSYLIYCKITDDNKRYWVLFIASFVLLVVIVAAAALDLFYYNRLLQGAVDALLEFEKEHPVLNMSTLIDKQVSYLGRFTIYAVYFILFMPLLCITTWAWRKNRSVNKAARSG